MELNFIKRLVTRGVREPEGNVFIAGGELAVRLELGDLTGLELRNEPIILTPE